MTCIIERLEIRDFEKFTEARSFRLDLKPITILSGYHTEVMSEIIKSLRFLKSASSDSQIFGSFGGYHLPFKGGRLLQTDFNVNHHKINYWLSLVNTKSDPDLQMRETLWVNDNQVILVDNGQGYTTDDNGSSQLTYSDPLCGYKSALSRSVYLGREKFVQFELLNYLQNIDLVTLDIKTTDYKNEFIFDRIRDLKNRLVILEIPERNLHPDRLPEVVDFLQMEAESLNKQFIISTFSASFLDALKIDRKGQLDPMIRIYHVSQDQSGIKIEDVNDLRQEYPSLDGWATDFGIGKALLYSNILPEGKSDSKKV